MRGVDLRLNSKLHQLGERADLPRELKAALAWWVSAELIRRHPDEVRVIETHPGGGQYDCLSLYRREHHAWLIAHLNILGHITHGTLNGEMNTDFDNRFNWFEVLNARSRRGYVIRQLESATGLSSPTRTPETTRRSIGPRWVARIAAQGALASRPWTILNGFLDSSQGSDVRSELFEPYPHVRLEPLDDDLFQIPHYRFWFVLGSRQRPLAAIDVDQGLLWLPGMGGSAIDLLDAYRGTGGKLDLLSREFIPPMV